METSEESVLSAEQALYEEMFEEHTIILKGPDHCPHFQGWCVEHDSVMEDEYTCHQFYDDNEPTEAELGYNVGASPWIQFVVLPELEAQIEE